MTDAVGGAGFVGATATNGPELVQQTWVNVYHEWCGYMHLSREDADTAAKIAQYGDRISVLRRDFFDDGTCVPVLEDV